MFADFYKKQMLRMNQLFVIVRIGLTEVDISSLNKFVIYSDCFIDIWGSLNLYLGVFWHHKTQKDTVTDSATGTDTERQKEAEKKKDRRLTGVFSIPVLGKGVRQISPKFGYITSCSRKGALWPIFCQFFKRSTCESPVSMYWNIINCLEVSKIIIT